MEKKRFFIALSLNQAFRDRIAPVILSWKEKFPQFRWLPEDKWHLTILPPHYWDNREIDLAIKSLSQGLKIRSFNLRTEKIVLGPMGGEKRMVWLVFEDQKEFLNLKRSVTSILIGAGLSIDSSREKEIIHLTLARFKGIDFFGFQEKMMLIPIAATEIELWRVFLNPGGAAYHSLASFNLL